MNTRSWSRLSAPTPSIFLHRLGGNRLPYTTQALRVVCHGINAAHRGSQGLLFGRQDEQVLRSFSPLQVARSQGIVGCSLGGAAAIVGCGIGGIVGSLHAGLKALSAPPRVQSTAARAKLALPASLAGGRRGLANGARLGALFGFALSRELSLVITQGVAVLINVIGLAGIVVGTGERALTSLVEIARHPDILHHPAVA